MKSRVAAIFILLIIALPVHAFDYMYGANGSPERWSITTPDVNISTNSFDRNTHAIRFYLESDAYSTTNTANELNALRNVFGQWQSVPNTIIKYEDAGLVPPGQDVNTSDNSNIVFWAKQSTMVNGGHSDISGALAVTFSSFFPTSTANDISQFDIAINGVQSTWFTDFNDKNNPGIFVEGPILHEVGHSLGLNHSVIGGATMLWDSGSGVNPTAGLSVDEIEFAHALYSSGTFATTLGNLKGTVTKNGSPVFGAAVILEGLNGILVSGTATLTNGTYLFNAIPPGNYNARIVPLDPANASNWLIRGTDVASIFATADTSFLPTGNMPVTLAANTTNTANFTVTNGTQAFHITLIRSPTSTPNTYSISGQPISLSLGESNQTIGVFSADLPANNATLAITGDGLTLGTPTFAPGNVFSGLNGISVSIGVSSNATPGLRSFIVQQGTNIAYANGFIEVLPLVADFNFDGLDDVFQRQYFFPFTSSNAAPAADPDHDGFNNAAEYVAGTNPTDAASFLKLDGVTHAANGNTVTWQSVASHRYQLVFSTNLVTGTWQNVGGVVTANGTTASELDTSTNPLRFYRIEALP
ncbi:MAG TPA: matrixin family metalloprotease [Verrucomicrobiae bacterium]|jgi:hypothetical protein|nr:matrixin family metalloprotease [Verrucomicrobiae bacterium]